jgi:Rrf2 family protein
MKLVPTRRTDYAIRALVFIENADTSPVKANTIGDAMGIPTGFLQQVLRELLGAGLVTSRPGPAGGFTLARPADQITVLQIVEAMEGPLRTSECALRGGPCHWDDVCALHRVWSAARNALCEQLDDATLAQVASDDRALAAGELAIPVDSHRRPASG